MILNESIIKSKFFSASFGNNVLNWNNNTKVNLKEVGKRLSTYMRAKDLGINQLGRLSKMSGAQVANIVNAKNYGFNKLLNILNVCPDLNVNWLLEGQGEMLKNANHAQETDYLPGADIHPKSSAEVLHYQKLTIEAYKNSVEILTATNKDLRELVEFYKGELKTIKQPAR